MLLLAYCKDLYKHVFIGLNLAFALSLFSCSTTASAEDVVELRELKASIHFDEKELYKISPSLLVEQAKASLAQVEENTEVLCERHVGYIRDFYYSMLCYTSKESKGFVTVLGEVRKGDRLWNYQVKLPNGNLPNQLMLVLEAISRFTNLKLKDKNAIGD